MATLNDIATQLDVSPGLVSGVLNGKTVRTRDETRQRIIDLARELDYRPSAAARALVTGKTRQIAVVIGEAALLSADSGTLHGLRGIMKAAHEHDYRVLVVPLAGADHAAIENLAASRMCDGFCVPAQHWSAKLEHDFTARAVPYVLMGDTGDNHAPRVDHDNYRQYFDSVAWLAAQGHQRIGLAATTSAKPQPFQKRILAGFDDALKKHTALRASARRELHFAGEPSDEAIADWVRAARPTAVIVYSGWKVLQWKRVLEAPNLAAPGIVILGHIDVADIHLYSHIGGSFQGLAFNLFDSSDVGHQAARALFGEIEGRPASPILLPSRGPHWWHELDGT